MVVKLMVRGPHGLCGPPVLQLVEEVSSTATETVLTQNHRMEEKNALAPTQNQNFVTRLPVNALHLWCLLTVVKLVAQGHAET